MISLLAALCLAAAPGAPEDPPASAAPAAQPSPPVEPAPQPAAGPSSGTAVSSSDAASPGAQPVAGGGETVVTATRAPRPTRDLPWSVVVLPRAEIDRSPTLTTDALVRTVPSVATFRRNTSLVADPTSQGLNLRGVGPSGVSRALVLLDGTPLSEPFGGWVFWRSVPRLGLERVEIAPGPGSGLYGSAAMGGVVQLISRPLTPSTLEAELVGGSYRTVEAAARATHVWERFGFGLEGEFLRTDGFMIVSPEIAGEVDRPAHGDHLSLSARAEGRLGEGASLALRGGYFDQSQNGGTLYTASHTRRFDLSLRAEQRLGEGSLLEATLFGRRGQFDQTRARIFPGRQVEALSVEQTVPTTDLGGALLWRAPMLRALGEHRLSTGADVRWAQGESQETLHPFDRSDNPLVGRTAGGEQLAGGLFVQDEWTAFSGLELLASLRYDGWMDRGGHRRLTYADGDQQPTGFESRTAQQLSPRAGVLYRPQSWLAVRASAGTAFRAPTLNELYRPFQVGTVLTAANPELEAERLWGGEAGVELSPGAGVVARATGFLNRLENAVSNVTLPEPLEDGSQRRRENLGAARIRGVELGLDWRVLRRLWFVLGYTYVDAIVIEAPGLPELIGKRLPQDPEHRGAAAITFDEPRWFTATAQVRVTGLQFEDDLNELPMGGYAVVDVSASRRLHGGLEVFAAVENLFDRRYVVGRAGIDTYGQPLTLRAGLRLRR